MREGLVRDGFYITRGSRSIVRFLCCSRFGRRGLRALFLAAVATRSAAAQSRDSVARSPNYWNRFALGVTTSILLHEAAHIGVALAIGEPTFGFDKLRPTVYSGINSSLEPHKQFLFSAAGLTLQTVLDEAILDVPHNRGSAFERGLLAGGIGTTVFYLTLGRRGSVSDIEYMARMHGMTRAQSTLVYGGFAALHAFRIRRDDRYANFFARPRANGGLDFGVHVDFR
jgi:hypothetical protein